MPSIVNSVVAQWTSTARRPCAAQILSFAAKCSMECYRIRQELVAVAAFCRGGCDLCLLEELVLLKVLRGFVICWVCILFITPLFDLVIQKLYSNVHLRKCAVCSSEANFIGSSILNTGYRTIIYSTFSFSWRELIKQLYNLLSET